MPITDEDKKQMDREMGSYLISFFIGVPIFLIALGYILWG